MREILSDGMEVVTDSVGRYAIWIRDYRHCGLTMVLCRSELCPCRCGCVLRGWEYTEVS